MKTLLATILALVTLTAATTARAWHTSDWFTPETQEEPRLSPLGNPLDASGADTAPVGLSPWGVSDSFHDPRCWRYVLTGPDGVLYVEFPRPSTKATPASFYFFAVRETGRSWPTVTRWAGDPTVCHGERVRL